MTRTVRLVQRWRGRWLDTTLADLRTGELFRMFEPEGARVTWTGRMPGAVADHGRPDRLVDGSPHPLIGATVFVAMAPGTPEIIHAEPFGWDADVAEIHGVTQDVHKIAISKGWHDATVKDADGKIHPAQILAWVALVGTELAEAVEEVRAGTEPIYEGENGKPEGLAIELADVVIRVMDMAGALDLDLAGAMAIKMAWNRTRPYRHGGKRA